MSTPSGRRHETASVAAWPQASTHHNPNPNQGEQGNQGNQYSGYSDYSNYSGGDHHQTHHAGTAAAPDLQNLQGLQAPQQPSSTSTSNPSSNTNISSADISHQNQQGYRQNQSNTAYMNQHQQYTSHGQHNTQQQQQYAPAYMGSYYQVSGDQYNFVPGNYPQPQQPELGSIIEEHSGQEPYHHHHVPQTAHADITKHHYQPAVQVTEIPEGQEVGHATSIATVTVDVNNEASNYSGSFHNSSGTHATSEMPSEQPQVSNIQPTRTSTDSAQQLNPASDHQISRSRDQTGPDPGRQSNSHSSSPVDNRKRARVESSNEEDTGEADSNRKPKPPRGRPRVTTAGESQRDRRRKQIRDAQRAYRNRKDQAILDLEAKVKKLEDEKKDMAHEVSGFLDAVNTQSSMHHNPELSLRSRNLSHKVLALRTAGDVEGTVAHTQSNDSNNSNEGFTFVAPSAQGPTHHMSQAGMASYNYYNPENLSYEVITQPTPENASFPSYIPNLNAPGLWNQHSLLSSQLANQAHGTLPSPRTYCAQESTFGRRLQRTSTERGLSLAMMERPPPDIFGAVFGFCLLFESRQDIVARLSTRLHILATETLHNWTVPFTNLGGAGRHSQEAGSSAFGQPGGPLGNEGYVQTSQPQHGTGFSMGPWRASVEEVRDTRLDKESRMNYGGFEGDFLDSDEVELYLRQRGIFIPGSADFVDVEIDLKDFESTNGAPIIRAPSTQQKAIEREAAREQMKRAVEAQSLENSQQMVLSTGGNNTFNSTDPFMAMPDDSWAPAMPAKLKATMDIAVLIEELANCSVCLGRTPGTRPKDIDRAVKIAVGINEK